MNYIQYGGFRVMGGGLADWLARHSVGLFHSRTVFKSLTVAGWIFNCNISFCGAKYFDT